MIDAAVRSERQLPPPPGYELSSNAPAAPYRSELSEMLARQVQAVQGMSQYTSGYGGSMRPAYPIAVMSSTRSSLNLGQNDPRVVPQPRGDGNGGGGARTMLSGPPQAYRRPNQLGGARRDMTPLAVPPPMHQSRPRQQYAAATQPRLNASSRQPLAQDPHSSPNDMLSNQTGTAGGINRNDNERKQLMVKLPLSRELKSKVCNLLSSSPLPKSSIFNPNNSSQPPSLLSLPQPTLRTLSFAYASTATPSTQMASPSSRFLLCISTTNSARGYSTTASTAAASMG
jgi:hypothetical protein